MPARWSRRSRLARPSLEALAIIDPARHERLLAWAAVADGGWLLGTDQALYLPAGNAASARRLAWEEIERADWQGDDNRLVVVETADWGQPELSTTVSLGEPGRLPELVQERVTRSVVYSRFTAIDGRRGLTVVGRRSPIGVGAVAWSWLLSPGLDPDDPVVAEAAEQALAAARSEVGE